MPHLPPLENYITWPAGDPIFHAPYRANDKNWNPGGAYEKMIRGAMGQYQDFVKYNFAMLSIFWALKARHVYYWKKQPPTFQNGLLVDPGDNYRPGVNVPKSAAITTISDVSKGLRYAALGTQAGFYVAGSVAASTGATGGVSALAAVSSAIGWATFGAAIVAIPITMIFQHHAMAVAKEQADLSAAWSSYMSVIPQIDAAVQGGIKLQDGTVVDAKQGSAMLDELQTAFLAWTQPVDKECNEACILRMEMQACNDFRKQILYPQWEKQSASLATRGTKSKTELELAAAGAAALAIFKLGAASA